MGWLVAVYLGEFVLVELTTVLCWHIEVDKSRVVRDCLTVRLNFEYELQGGILSSHQRLLKPTDNRLDSIVAAYKIMPKVIDH